MAGHPVPERPGPGQESVWSYPRPPRLEASSASIEISFGGVQIVRTTRSYRVLETSHPPVHYVSIDDVLAGVLRPTDRHSWCEWKGEASYLDVVVDVVVDGAAGRKVGEAAAWTYESPTEGFGPLVNHVAFYPARMDSCRLAGELVEAQPGDFYGGWRTSKVVGPFKGAAGTWGW